MNIEEQYDKIFRFCYYRVHNRETAEDLTQETFLKFFGSDYEERGEGIRYLYTIARNLCIDESRRKVTDELADDFSDEGMETDELIGKIHIEQILGEMTEDDRELLILRFMNGESLTDICNITGMSRFALYRRINRIKNEFVQRMEGGDYRG